MKRNNKGLYIALSFLALALYCTFAATVYRFSHPEQTETQLLMNIFDALLWRW